MIPKPILPSSPMPLNISKINQPTKTQPLANFSPSFSNPPLNRTLDNRPSDPYSKRCNDRKVEGLLNKVRLENQQAQPTATCQSQNEWKGGWQELADFFVSFGFTINQNGETRLATRVHHSQVDKSEQWCDLPLSQIVDWILRQANIAPAIAAPSHPPLELPAALSRQLSEQQPPSQPVTQLQLPSSASASTRHFPVSASPVFPHTNQPNQPTYNIFLLVFYAVVGI